MSADQARATLVRESWVRWGEGWSCFKTSPGTPGRSRSFMAIHLQKGWCLSASGRQCVTQLKHKQVKSSLNAFFLEAACFFWAKPWGIQTLSRHAKGQPSSSENSNHMIFVQWGRQTPLSLPPFCSLLETLEIRPDVVLTNALQGMSLHGPWE